MREPIQQYCGEGCHRECNQAGMYAGTNDTHARSRRGSGDGMSAQENNETREAPIGGDMGVSNRMPARDDPGRAG